MSQSSILAKNYFDQGEYEKAISLYEKLAKKKSRTVGFSKIIGRVQSAAPAI
jgi:pentatricopeptide repeat protein